jgi:hypothetical protein
MAAKMGFESNCFAISFAEHPTYNKRRAQQLVREVVVSIIIEVTVVVVPYLIHNIYRRSIS